MRGARWKLALGAAVAALFVCRWMAHYTADRLWAEALGVRVPHSDIALLQLALAVGASAIATAWFLGNLLLVYRQIGAVQVPRQVGNLEILEHVPRRYLLTGAIVVGSAMGVMSGYGAGDLWAIRALSGSSVAIGQADPVLGHDYAYYLFELPWLRALQGHALWLTSLALVLIALLYAAIGALRREERRLVFMPFARWHLAALSGTLAVTLAWGYALEPAELVAGLHGVPYDTVLLDVRVPAALLLAVLAIGVAATSLVWMRVDRVRIPAIAWSSLLATTFFAHFVVPAAVAGGRGAAGRVDPDLAAAEAKVWGTALGAAADTVPVPLAIPGADFAERHARDLGGAPIWDAFVLTELLNRVARPMPPDPRGSGRFFGAALTLLGRPGQTAVAAFLAVREPDSLGTVGTPGGPPDAAVGTVAVPASRTASGGLPLFLPDLARLDSAVARPVDVTLGGATWFSPGMSGFALVPGDLGPLGVPVGSLARRVALAWALQAPGLLSGERVPAGTLVVAERAVAARLARYAPFARFGAGWPAVLDGRLVWMAWGYVAAEGYPLGSPVVWRGQRIRSLRAGFLGTVDAGTGLVRVYLAENADAVSRAWQRALPDLVLSFDAVPMALRSFLRYPEELFTAQLQLLRGRGGRVRPVEPHWWVGPSIGDSVVRLRLRAVDEVQIEPRVAAVIEGFMDGGVPRLRVLRYPAPYTLPGPSELERDFASAAPGGAAVSGRLRLLPFEDGALAMQAFYADSGTLAGIVAGWPGAIGTGPTLTEALRRVAPNVPGAGVAAPTMSYEAAREWFLRLDRARAGADWEAFGEAWAGLRAALGLGEEPAPGRVAPPIPRD